MSYMKRELEELSVEMGHEGEINEAVMEEARQQEMQIPPTTIPVIGTLREDGQVESRSRKMDVTIPRDAIESLLEYTEAEIETRCGCLKDAGDDHDALQVEIDEANDLCASVRRTILAQRHRPINDVRSPINEMGDKMERLRTALLGDPVMKADKEMRLLHDQLQMAYASVVCHLNNNYRWD